MFLEADRDSGDTAGVRKARGAFFTPDAIARFIVDWAVRDQADTVLEPSAGDAAFLVQAVRRLKELGGSQLVPTVSGVEIHEYSARIGRKRVIDAGGDPIITVSDFFDVDPEAKYSAVVGNPPYIRFQDFAGDARGKARAAALRAGVPLTGLASSWAAFTVQSASFVKPGGRLALVLPAELLSVNYAGPVRRFLFDSFGSVNLVLFEHQVFAEAEADVVLVLADQRGGGPATHATVHQAVDASSLADTMATLTWTPADPAGKWTGLALDPEASEPLKSLLESGQFTHLESWGETTLGMVTGNNQYFTLSPRRVAQLKIARRDLIRISPPGSGHLRGLDLTSGMLSRLGSEGKSTWLFRPSNTPSAGARAYIQTGEARGVDQAYKCRVRTPWYRVPLVPAPDLFLTYMNADTPRLTHNAAGAHHLNSVHGVYLSKEAREIGPQLLAIASVNSVTMLHAELVGRSYGGGVLKIEPREADRWAVPSIELVTNRRARLEAIRERVHSCLAAGQPMEAARLVDTVLFDGIEVMDREAISAVRAARAEQMNRRLERGKNRG